MPSVCPISFPSPMKMDAVRVRKPLSFLGEDSPRYIRCTFSPRPGGNKRLRRTTYKKIDDQWASSGHTDIVSIEKPSQKDHLK